MPCAEILVGLFDKQARDRDDGDAFFVVCFCVRHGISVAVARLSRQGVNVTCRGDSSTAAIDARTDRMSPRDPQSRVIRPSDVTFAPFCSRF